jgi:hypothetical protein
LKVFERKVRHSMLRRGKSHYNYTQLRWQWANFKPGRGRRP